MKKFQFFPEKYGVLPYIYLAYLVIPLYYVINETGLKAVIGYVFLLLFLMSYRQLYSVISWRIFSYWLILQIGIVMVFSVAYNPYNLFMGFFSANFIGWYGNKKHFNRALLFFASAIILTIIVLALQDTLYNLFYFLPFAIVMIGAPFGIRSMNERMALEQRLDQANEQIKDLIKREERVRIARDLHDTLGHTLSLITLQSQLVQRIAEKHPDRVKTEAKEIERTARAALQQVRELVSDMRAITIAEELADMEQILKAAGIQFHMEDQTELPELPLLQQNIVGMCLREAATNIVKHSGAQNCVVTFEDARGNFTITVKDDGVGISERNEEGNGLSGMRERLALIDGRLALESGGGTTVELAVPVIVKEEAVAL
ncbi:sensor histidine kinase [Sporosarcina sp. YIM B06819]|uniref:sensor histidine kinase n=1 Tax=Sporosarcina sp. YIM B06819 TaxID=3081769 RepID=UPI00298BD459|nr:sensor histidine kinase [Sporosarcina sp. YIM B06819]